MTYKQYTHDIVIKNSSEFIYNALIEHETGNTYISSVQKSSEHTIKKKDSKRTIAIPGLINLHCHLVHTNIKISSQNLFSWLKELVKNNYNINHIDEVELLRQAAFTGAQEALSFGTTFLVDNTHNLEASYEALNKTGLRGLIGLEIFGSDPDKADIIMENASVILSAAKDLISRHCEERSDVAIQSGSRRDARDDKISFCLSPHACYDVSAELWKMILEYSKKHHLKVLSHIAESAAEEAWFRDKDSKLSEEAREFWTEINTLDPKLKNWKAYKSSVDFMKENNLLNSSLLLAHGVHCSSEDLQDLKKNNVSLVTCPRSNLYLKNGLADYETWEELGIDYGIGTDSKASNYNLDLREEAAQIPGLSAERKFELLTSKPAEILSLTALGSLEAGKEADWVVLEILDEDLNFDEINPYELALDTTKTKIKEVYIAAKQVYSL